MLKASRAGNQSPYDVNNPNFMPEVVNPKDNIRGVSVEKQNYSYGIHSRSESINKPRDREPSESRATAEKRREDSATPSRVERDRKTPKEDFRKELPTASTSNKPSPDFVAKTHQKIETKSKKSNIAKMNNTTFEETSQANNRHKSPGASVSPGPRREPTNEAVSRDLISSTNIDSGSSFCLTSEHQQKDPAEQDQRDQRSRQSRPQVRSRFAGGRGSRGRPLQTEPELPTPIRQQVRRQNQQHLEHQRLLPQ